MTVKRCLEFFIKLPGSLLLLVLAVSVRAESVQTYLGMTISQQHLTFYPTPETLEPAATMVNSFLVLPVVRLNQPVSQSISGRWHVELESEIRPFFLDQQLVGTEERQVHLNTQVWGVSGHITPVIRYQGQLPWFTCDCDWSAGLGAGVGILWSEGHMKLTESTNDRVAVSVSGADLAVSLQSEIRFQRWIFGVRAAGPEISWQSGSLSFVNISVEFGYRF